MERGAAKGYTVPDWPKPYGGAGMTPFEAKIWREEMNRIGARPPLSSVGIWMLGPALLQFGSEEQKFYYPHQIPRRELQRCQGLFAARAVLMALREGASRRPLGQRRQRKEATAATSPGPGSPGPPRELHGKAQCLVRRLGRAVAARHLGRPVS